MKNLKGLNKGFLIFWVTWLVMLIIVEGAAVLNPAPGDTLSEFVWAVERALPITVVPLAIGLAWLTWHWLHR